MSAAARIGVAVVTRDRRAGLLRTLARLEALPERPPVVVVDNGSSDGTPAAVRARHPAVDVVALPDNRGAVARTLGAERLGTEHVAFADDDSWWEPGALARAAEVLDAHPRLGAVAARVVLARGDDPVCEAMARSPLGADGLPGPRVLGFVACGVVVRRAPFLAVGGFHRRLGTGAEEQLLAIDLALAGWGIAYVPDVVAQHRPSGARDRGARRRQHARNELWGAWLRRRPGGAVRTTATTAGAALRDRAVAGGLVDALRGARWVLGERRAVPRELERALRALE